MPLRIAQAVVGPCAVAAVKKPDVDVCILLKDESGVAKGIGMPIV